MWYIFKNNNGVSYSHTKPATAEHFTIDKMPPIPNDKYMELQADFENETVWFEKRELTKEEAKEERANEIKLELEVLDNTVDRQWEDYYIKWEITPVDRIAIVIAKKEALRQQLKEVL